MKWIKEWLDDQRDRAIRESGKQAGKAEAYKDVLDLLDPNGRCQACGYSFYNKESKEKHFEGHPDHVPATGPTPESE